MYKLSFKKITKVARNWQKVKTVMPSIVKKQKLTYGLGGSINRGERECSVFGVERVGDIKFKTHILTQFLSQEIIL